jgi:chitinase
MVKKFIEYFPAWSIYSRNYFVKDLPIDYIPEIVYAFFNLILNANGNYIIGSGDPWGDLQKIFSASQDVDSSVNSPILQGNFGQFQKLKNQGKKFRLTLGVGGWTWSTNFSKAVSTDQARNDLVQSVIDFFNKYSFFDGIVWDWEYVSDNGVNYGNLGNNTNPKDASNWVIFLTLLRQKLKDNNLSNKSVAMCVTSAIDYLHFPVEQVTPLIDEYHIMTYDFHSGSWGETITAHQTNLKKSSYGKYSVEEAVQMYLNRGVSSQKLLIGVAFYSRGFGNTDGLGKTASGGSPDMSWEAGVCDYKSLPRAGANEFWDEEALAGYSYDSTKKIFNSYDTVQSTIEKCKFVYDKDLLGIICWEASGDFDISNDKSLTKTLHENLILKDPRPPIPITTMISTIISTIIPITSSSTQFYNKDINRRPPSNSVISTTFIIIFVVVLFCLMLFFGLFFFFL